MPAPFVDPSVADPNAVPDSLQEAPQASGALSTPVPQVTPGLSVPVEPTSPTTFNQNAATQIGLQADIGQATKEKTDAEVAANQGEADLLKSQADESKAKLDEMKHFADQSLMVHATNQDAQRQELSRLASIKTDPDHWWNNKDTGGKMSAIGGLLLGGIGQGLLLWGGAKDPHNSALDSMEREIKNDIDSQDKNLRNQWDVYSAKNNLSNNEDNFRNFAMQHKQQQLINGFEVNKIDLQKQMSLTKNPIMQANGKLALTAIDQKIADLRRDQGLHAEQQAAAVAAQLREVQKAELAHQRALQVLGVTGAQKLEEEGLKGQVELAKQKEIVPEKEHEAELAQINSERVRLQQQQLQAHNGFVPWDTTKEKMAQSNLDALDKKEKEANDKYLASKRSSTPKTVTSAKDLP